MCYGVWVAQNVVRYVEHSNAGRCGNIVDFGTYRSWRNLYDAVGAVAIGPSVHIGENNKTVFWLVSILVFAFGRVLF
jgi:hypothetical protein